MNLKKAFKDSNFVKENPISWQRSRSHTKTVHPITQKRKIYNSFSSHHLKLLQKSLLAHGLERSRKKIILFSQKVLIDLTEYPLMQGCLVCSIALRKHFSRRKSHTFLLLGSYALFLKNCIWISKIDVNKDQNLSFIFYFLKNWK